MEPAIERDCYLPPFHTRGDLSKMPYSNMLQVCQLCSTCTSCWSPRSNRKRRVTRFTAVFSDDWKWSFNSKDHRSRRRRFANSGELISGFAAVFCDDWKDDEDEDEAPPRPYEYVRPQRCHSLQWDKGCKRKRGADDFAELLTSTWPPCNRQCEEHCYSSRAATTFSAASPMPQQYQLGESESEKWPPSPATLESLTPSSIMSANDEETSTQGLATPEDTTPSLPSSVRSMVIDIASLTETERDLYLALASDETGDPSSALTDLVTKGQDCMMPSSEPVPDHHWFREDECGIGDKRLNDWDQFMECSIGADGGRELEGCQELDTLQEMRLEHDFEEFIDC